MGDEAAEDARKKKQREADAAKKAASEVEEVLDDAHVTTELKRLDLELLGVEGAGYGIVEDWRTHENVSREFLAVKVEREAAEARNAYAKRFQVDCRGKAAWAARKIAEARTNLEAAKAAMRAEVKRAERDLEGRLAFFEDKILAWADPEPKDKGTKGSIRFPEAGVRVEVRDAELGGVHVLDEALLCQEIVDKLGIMVAEELGLVKLRPQLCPEEVRAYLASHPELKPEYAHVEPSRTGKKLVVVRLQK